MGAAAPIALAGGVLSAYGSLSEGQAKSAALEEEARAAEENAVIARKAGKYNALKQSIVADKTIGSMNADYASSGISSDSGSVMDVLRSSHINAELDRQNILYESEMKARNYESRAKAARQGASSAQSAGTINAFASLFSAGANAYAKAGD